MPDGDARSKWFISQSRSAHADAHIADDLQRRIRSIDRRW